MTRKDMFMTDQKDRKRLHVIRKVIEGEMTQVEAAVVVGLSDRQIRRLMIRVQLEGDLGICHKSRGKRSNRRRGEKIKKRILELCEKRYKGFGPTLAVEKLLEEKGIKLSDETLRLWLSEAGIAYPKRKKRPHRQWRERRAHFGSLVQLDGSHHAWFEERGPKSVLMAYIDDATGKVEGGFYEYEGTFPAMESFKEYVLKYGLPLAVYADKHSTYKSTGEPTVEEQLEGIEPMSQFERGLKELGVEMIHAHSPQAKGRIERLFGTLQDRLVKEMRLAGINQIKEANAYLKTYWPKFNKQFSVLPSQKADLHRSTPSLTQMAKTLCIKTERTLRNDFTISYQTKLYQVKENLRTKKIIVEERLDGTIHLSHREESLTYQEITNRTIKMKQEEKIIKRKKINRATLPNLFNRCPKDKITKAMATSLT
jgi:transposase